jgi:hypothetical protein
MGSAVIEPCSLCGRRAGTVDGRCTRCADAVRTFNARVTAARGRVPARDAYGRGMVPADLTAAGNALLSLRAGMRAAEYDQTSAAEIRPAASWAGTLAAIRSAWGPADA